MNDYILYSVLTCVLILYIILRTVVRKFYFHPSAKLLTTDYVIETLGSHVALVRKHMDSKRCLIISHGNAGNISYRNELFNQLKSYDGDIYCYEYQGFGNMKGKVSIKGCIDEHLFWIRHLAPKYSEIDLWGESIGGGVLTETITYLNKKKIEDKEILRKINKVYLQSTFSSLKSVITHMMTILGGIYSFFMLNDFDTIGNLAHSNFKEIEVINLHSQNDEIIPFSETQLLKNACEKNYLKYKLIPIKGGHNDSVIGNIF